MAITRCPYCHAIIDEADKYCNNCGTQLLFPEDEEIEEDIPGEKILDAELEEKDYEIDEPDAAERAPEIDETADDASVELTEETEEIDLEDLIEKEPSGTAGAEEPEEEEPEGEEDEPGDEVIVLDEAELGADAAGIFPEGEPPPAEDRPASPEERLEGEPPPAEEEAPEPSSDAPVEHGQADEPDEETAPPAATAPGPVPPTFDTVELENMGKTVELGKDKMDRILEAMAETQAPEEAPKEGPRKDEREPTGSLPPWASTMKGAPAFEEVKDTADLEPKIADKGPWEVGEEEIFPRKKPSDSTMGIPERVTQADLPFGSAAADEAGREAGEEEEERGEEPEEAQEEAEETGLRGFLRTGRREEAAALEPEPDRETGETGETPHEGLGRVAAVPFDISSFLKAKAFDVLFVGLFWIAALWLAAGAVGTTLFGILAALSGPMLLLYAIFVLIYLFFFKFFLGETLGERLFRNRE